MEKREIRFKVSIGIYKQIAKLAEEYDIPITTYVKQQIIGIIKKNINESCKCNKDTMND